MFLEYIGEDSITISKIIDCQEAENPIRTLNFYLMYNMRLEWNSNRQEFEWEFGWGDSLFVCKCAEYLTQKIICDTALYLVEPYLLEAFYVNLSTYRYCERLFLNCAEFLIANFHTGQVISIPITYYNNHKEQADWQDKLRFYEMIKFILLAPKHVYSFDKETNEKCNIIIANNEESPYYNEFRSLINKYSCLDMARITKAQEKELIRTLQQGIANGEKKARLTFAFMLLTGQFIEQEEELGNEILSALLK